MGALKKFIKKRLKFSCQPEEGRREAPRLPIELSKEEREVIAYVQDHNLTMTSYERCWTTLMACKHVIHRNIAGDFVECGVWRGGNALIAASIFKIYSIRKRVYLFDTFAGMTAPSDRDKEVEGGEPAAREFLLNQKEMHNEWCYASLEDVRRNFADAGLLEDNIVFVQDDVCATLTNERNLPSEISALRLDTDWYDSTMKELEVLYPRLSTGGVFLIDDYGHWAGAKEATDEYFKINDNRPFLQYVDYTGRAGVKTS